MVRKTDLFSQKKSLKFEYLCTHIHSSQSCDNIRIKKQSEFDFGVSLKNWILLVLQNKLVFNYGKGL